MMYVCILLYLSTYLCIYLSIYLCILLEKVGYVRPVAVWAETFWNNPDFTCVLSLSFIYFVKILSYSFKTNTSIDS